VIGWPCSPFEASWHPECPLVQESKFLLPPLFPALQSFRSPLYKPSSAGVLSLQGYSDVSKTGHTMTCVQLCHTAPRCNSPESWKAKITVSAGSISPEDSAAGCRQQGVGPTFPTSPSSALLVSLRRVLHP
jgi:hypothetical protein